MLQQRNMDVAVVNFPLVLYWWTEPECVEVAVSCVECTMNVSDLESHYVYLVSCDVSPVNDLTLREPYVGILRNLTIIISRKFTSV